MTVKKTSKTGNGAESESAPGLNTRSSPEQKSADAANESAAFEELLAAQEQKSAPGGGEEGR